MWPAFMEISGKWDQASVLKALYHNKTTHFTAIGSIGKSSQVLLTSVEQITSIFKE